jgi:hypothetical protein
MVVCTVLGLGLLSTPVAGYGHMGHSATDTSAWLAGSVELTWALPLIVSVGLYATGPVQLWRQAGWGRGVPWWGAPAG